MLDIKQILKDHDNWLRGYGGSKADLQDADLSGANISGANLRGANLRDADLSGANISGANLRGANLRGAYLSAAHLSDANLRGANLIGANLRFADLCVSDLSVSDLSGADLRDANLRDANLSRAEGLVSAINFMESHFERNNDGYIAYKTFGERYAPPATWKIEPGSVISENVNFTRTQDCGNGINVAPLEWVKTHYTGRIWKVLIRWEWLCGVCVPYNTDGKIRCERVELVMPIDR